ncbi:MAG: hypothetical protein IJX13_08730 [Clostridia bacterium]|nr:hypothetical protein [Clostridia bacterium]
MNRYLQNESAYNSNNDIFDLYFLGKKRSAAKWKKAADGLLALLAALISFFAEARVIRLVRTGAVALCLVGLIGIIGAMECGGLSLAAGLVISSLLLVVEIVCLRRR